MRAADQHDADQHNADQHNADQHNADRCNADRCNADQYNRVILFVNATQAGDVVASICRLIASAFAHRSHPPMRVLPVDGRRPARTIDAYRRLLRAAAPLDAPVVLRGLASAYLAVQPSTMDVVIGTPMATPTPALAAWGRMRIVPVGAWSSTGLQVVENDLRDPVTAGRLLRRLAEELVAEDMVAEELVAEDKVAEASRPGVGPIDGALRGRWHVTGLAVGRWARAALHVQNLRARRPTVVRLRGAGVDLRPTAMTVDVSPVGGATLTLQVRPWTTGAVPVEIRAANGDLGYAWLPGRVDQSADHDLEVMIACRS